MLRSFAPLTSLAFLLLLAPRAWADGTAAPAGSAPTQADIDEAIRQYFTNGAAVTGVPSSGPAADYFRNGASVLSVPTSGPGADYFQNGAEVAAYRDPEEVPPPVTAAPLNTEAVPAPAPAAAATGTPGTPAPAFPQNVGVSPSPGAVGVPGMAPSAPSVSTPGTQTNEVSTPEALPAATSGASPSRVESALPVRTTEPSGALALERTVQTSMDVLRWARPFPALGGALIGGLAIAFWSRARSPKDREKDAS